MKTIDRIVKLGQLTAFIAVIWGIIFALNGAVFVEGIINGNQWNWIDVALILSYFALFIVYVLLTIGKYNKE